MNLKMRKVYKYNRYAFSVEYLELNKITICHIWDAERAYNKHMTSNINHLDSSINWTYENVWNWLHTVDVLRGTGIVDQFLKDEFHAELFAKKFNSLID